MKKVLCWILCVLLCVSLYGCNSSGSDNSTDTANTESGFTKEMAAKKVESLLIKEIVKQGGTAICDVYKTTYEITNVTKTNGYKFSGTYTLYDASGDIVKRGKKFTAWVYEDGGNVCEIQSIS